MVVSRNDGDGAANQSLLEVESVPESDKNICDLIDQLEDYVPTVPDALTAYYLNTAGFSEVDERIIRVISVTAQKFISDIANDALQHCKSRSNSQHSGNHGANKVLFEIILNFLSFS